LDVGRGSIILWERKKEVEKRGRVLFRKMEKKFRESIKKALDIKEATSFKCEQEDLNKNILRGKEYEGNHRTCK